MSDGMNMAGSALGDSYNPAVPAKQRTIDRGLEQMLNALDGLDCMISELQARLIPVLEKEKAEISLEDRKEAKELHGIPEGSSDLFMLLGEYTARIKGSTRKLAQLETRIEV